ncbi:MAG TPA: choice-of-anchor D domain-containing protein [Myxococcota bacterium]|nr:choice-of-anchor D domain-containing protein [Myxococcota bacterium]
MSWLLLLVACEPIGPGSGVPTRGLVEPGNGSLSVDRTRIDYGALSVLTDGYQVEVLQVRNTGDAGLVVAGLNWIAGADVFFSNAPALVELDAGQTFDVTITFEPHTEGSYEAVVFPNGLVEIALTGEATAPVARLLEGDDTLDPVPVGCGASSTFALFNDGSEPLEVESLELGGGEDFSLEGDLPGELGPGEHVLYELWFQPLSGGAQDASVTLLSNDPASPSVGLTISALGVPGEAVRETLSYVPSQAVDLMFVVDSGPENATHLSGARDYASVLFDRLDGLGSDWHVTVGNGEDSCHSTFDPYLGSDVYDAETAGPALAYGLLPQGDGTRRLLQLAVQLVERTDSGECLEGFLRAEAMLHVVLVLSGEEASPQGLESYLDQLRDHLVDPDNLVISAIAGTGGACTHGGNAISAASETGGAVLDICEDDWDNFYTELADAAVSAAGGPLRVELELPAVPETIELTHEGRSLTAWSYQSDTATLEIDGVTEGLELGAQIDLAYLAAQVCP